MSLHLKLLDIDHTLTFEESKLRQIEAHALIYLSGLDFACVTGFQGRCNRNRGVREHESLARSRRSNFGDGAIR